MKAKYLFLIFLLCFVLLGCSGGKKVIVFGGDVSLGGVGEELVKLYNEHNPDIEIKLAPGKGESADVFAAAITQTAVLAEKNKALPLEKMLKAAEVEADKYVATAFSTVKYKDEIYGLPWYTDVGILYYRKDVVPYPPTTWDELVFLSQNYRDEKLWGIVFEGKQGEALVCNVFEYFWSNGGGVASGEGQRLYLQSEKNVDALRFLVNVVHWHQIAPEDVLEFSNQDAKQMFLDGRAIFMRGWSDALSEIDPRKVSVTDLPKGPEGSGGVSCLGGQNLYINPKTKYKNEAFAFIRWLTGEEAQKIIALQAGELPALRETYTDYEVQERKPYFSEVLPILYQARTRPQLEYYDAVSAILQNCFYMPMQKKAAVEASLKKATERVNKLINKEN
ncbi:MAG: extracellular solute-binding protein [Candidatus Margulisbacteria bacterium]|nr:extracellular solute-binding protein [Candidatus Margulisiibacteriota bacterium]MBU1021920.1 extracellular solute-binding protein [Candidatus Margulisiibacteriota bacterium]MBU1728558.1 extracellular solute-binding protein [Candidatus Margulisiibacteriota bacterium]MBU1954705.1 extracellular solute-binding protein [Candidatus Margulisiibacteriota bacterium]